MRERLALTEREAERFLRELVAREGVREAVAISTCNRTEIYLVVSDPVAGGDRAARACSPQRAQIRPTELLGRRLLAAQLRRRAPPASASRAASTR